MLDLNKIHQGHTLELLKQIDSDSIDCIITSPPYYGLRAYPNSETIWDVPYLDAENKVIACSAVMETGQHQWGDTITERTDETGWERNRKGLNKAAEITDGNPRQATTDNPAVKRESNFCVKCNAWKGQLGLEPDYKMYLKHILQITNELKRVLKPSGTLWWNMGDTYNGNPSNSRESNLGNAEGLGELGRLQREDKKIQAKSLMQLPERLAIRMSDEQGWILRNKVIWHKPNHMPSSVKDRLSSSYEVVYFFVKSKRYFFDLDAIRLKHKTESIERNKSPLAAYPEKMGSRHRAFKAGEFLHPLGKNPGDIFETKHDEAVASHGSYDDPLHTKPLNPLRKNPGDIIEGYDTKYSKESTGLTPQGFTRSQSIFNDRKQSYEDAKQLFPDDEKAQKAYIKEVHDHNTHPSGKNPGDILEDFWTITTQPHPFAHFAVYPEKLIEPMVKAGSPEGGIVLDPFLGSGTTALVALKLRRKFVGLEINSDYIKIAEERLKPYLNQMMLNS